MLAIQARPQATEKPAAAAEPVPLISTAPQLRYAHKPLPGGGRIFVTLTDGTPVGILRYELEQKDGLPLLLRALGGVVQERIERAEKL